MDEISNKAINIGVAIFITIIITSSVIYVINQIKVIYEQVYETDVSIQSSFNEFDEYDGNDKTGIDVINAAKKYIEKKDVNVMLQGNKINDENDLFYKKYNVYDNEKLVKLGKELYTSTISVNDGITTITFTKK